MTVRRGERVRDRRGNCLPARGNCLLYVRQSVILGVVESRSLELRPPVPSLGVSKERRNEHILSHLDMHARSENGAP